MAVKNPKRTPFLQRKNWFISAGLVMFLYLVLLFVLSRLSVDTTFLRNMCHALPLIAVAMVVLGIFDQRRKEDLESERAKHRYKIRLEMTKARREMAALEKAREAANKKTGGSTNESK